VADDDSPQQRVRQRLPEKGRGSGQPLLKPDLQAGFTDQDRAAVRQTIADMVSRASAPTDAKPRRTKKRGVEDETAQRRPAQEPDKEGTGWGAVVARVTKARTVVLQGIRTGQIDFGQSGQNAAIRKLHEMYNPKPEVDAPDPKRQASMARLQGAELQKSYELGILADAVNTSGDSIAPGGKEADAFVNALFSNPEATQRVLQSWSGQPPSPPNAADRRNRDAVNMALNDPYMATKVRERADSLVREGTQPGQTTSPKRLRDIQGVRAAAEPKMPAQRLDGDRSKRPRCPATEAQFAKQLGVAARDVIDAQPGSREHSAAVVKFREQIFSDPAVAKDFLAGNAGHIVDRGDPRKSRASMSVANASREATKMALADPAVAKELHSYAVGQGRYFADQNPQVVETARNTRDFYNSTLKPMQNDLAATASPSTRAKSSARDTL
jgi:hypothetical protein